MEEIVVSGAGALSPRLAVATAAAAAAAGGRTLKNWAPRRALISAPRNVLLQLASHPFPFPAEGPASLNEPATGGGGPGGRAGSNNGGGTTFDTLDPNVVIILVVLLFALICAAFLNSIMRCVMRRSNRTEEAAEEPQSVQGLDAKALAVLPVLSFRSATIGKLKEGSPAECTICLSDFVENEKVRLLPKCNHVFHIDCIDMWLLSHVSCPVCRDSIVEDPKLQTSIAVPASSSDPIDSSAASQSNMRAELLRERGGSSSSSSSSSASVAGPSDALVLYSPSNAGGAGGGSSSSSASQQAGVPGSRRGGRGSSVRASLYSMFAAENVMNLFTASIGPASRGHHLLHHSSASSSNSPADPPPAAALSAAPAAGRGAGGPAAGAGGS
ncbi:E3 ubiquitin-protein ligase ATL10/75/76/77/78 [Marchantia polymorpha subsp. ruderalis]|nr:hypothetical protein MARPO_0007s0036 [Marchantia polymorpha]BBN03892.1 hypothetical protein Mp_3g00390 [Marchantia polymorpha subsp. ruderalis]|eukprot:PTQ47581.1 hypothetical protein MARPO_0007s0036 [Marchantia polymorpha]